MRVLHIMSGFGGGISSFIYNKAIALKDQSVVFDVATYDPCSTIFEEAIKGTGGKIYPLQNPKKVGWRSFKESFVTILRTHQYDAIHCHITGYRAIPYYVLSRPHVKHFFLHAHSTTALHVQSPKQKLMRWVDQAINRRISESYLGCGRLANLSVYGNVPTTKMMVIPNSISTERYLLSDEEFDQRRKALKAEYQIKPDQLVIAQIGRLHKVKNTTHTIHLAEYLKTQQIAAKVYIIGAGAELEHLQQLVETKGLTDYVEFLGRIDKLETIMPLLDVLILPSLYEGLPTVVVEAQTIGLPCLMSDTITDEVDFDKGLVSYLSLEAPIEVWYQALVKLSKVKRPSESERQQVITDKGFSNKQSAKLYLDFLNQKISHYLIK